MQHYIKAPDLPLLLQVKADVLFFLQLMREQHEVVDIVDLACSLSSVGHDVKVRQAVGGGQNCFKNLHHEFLLVKVRALLTSTASCLS
jgi:hypothetical protein